MPSIEIICVDQSEPISFFNLPFAVEAENKLVSHRSPSPLFQADFNELCGCIYHLGNPSLRDPNASGCYTAYELLSKEKETEWWDIIHFNAEFIPHIRGLVQQLLLASPSGKVLFTSDYQFGPNAKRYKRPLTSERFWQQHDEKKLKMNALYQLKL
jgi:hypothetical protein